MALNVETSWSPYHQFQRTFTINLTASIVSCQSCVVYTTFVGNSVLSFTTSELNYLVKMAALGRQKPRPCSSETQGSNGGRTATFALNKEWGTCTSSCGCAKNSKTKRAKLPGWHRLFWGCLRTMRFSYFRERSCPSSAKTLPIVNILRWKRHWEVLLSLRMVHTLALFKFWWLRFAQSDLPRGHFLRSDAVLTVGTRRCEGQEGRTYWEVRVILPLPTHLQARSTTPSAFQVCRVRDLLDSEAGGDALSSCSFTFSRRDSRRRCCRHDSRSRSWTSEFLERTEEETETTTRWTTSFTTLDQ